MRFEANARRRLKVHYLSKKKKNLQIKIKIDKNDYEHTCYPTPYFICFSLKDLPFAYEWDDIMIKFG